MTGTFLALACLTIAAAAAPSTGSSTITSTPCVSAASPCCCCLAASLVAFEYRTLQSAQSFFTFCRNSGRSELSYRAVVFSGSRKAIVLPPPPPDPPPSSSSLPQALSASAARAAATKPYLFIDFLLQGVWGFGADPKHRAWSVSRRNNTTHMALTFGVLTNSPVVQGT